MDQSEDETDLMIPKLMEMTPQELEAEIPSWKTQAENGANEAQLYLGLCFMLGTGVPVSFSEAAKCEGVPKSSSEDFKYVSMSAHQGNAPAQAFLGKYYEDGVGVPQSFNEAFKYYKLAADQGDELAFFYLGLCYEEGKGVEQSLEEAIKSYTLGAEMGDSECKDALKWLRKEGRQNKL